jgi:hypothetical protein
MATISEIGEHFSERIRNAVARDGFTKAASVTEHQLRSSFTVREVFRIASEMRSFTIQRIGEEEQAIGEEEKNQIIDETAEKLGVSDLQVLRRVFKEASNQNFLALTSQMSQLVREIKK